VTVDERRRWLEAAVRRAARDAEVRGLEWTPEPVRALAGAAVGWLVSEARGAPREVAADEATAARERARELLQGPLPSRAGAGVELSSAAATARVAWTRESVRELAAVCLLWLAVDALARRSA
jgi:hypothetical protein